MTPRDVRKLVAWMQKYGLKVNEQLFFQMAYFHVYGKAEPRCQWCFERYQQKGIVPLFVRQFIQHHFLAKGDDHASKAHVL